MIQTKTRNATVEVPIVNPVTFVIATRDSGYRDIASAVAELVDNSMDAHASAVEIVVKKVDGVRWRIAVLDDGEGMSIKQLKSALQFGGTDRFNSRESFGRFGMGLPNASLSQARSIDMYSWGCRHSYSAHLSLDAIVSGENSGVLVRSVSELPAWLAPYRSSFKTAVVWSECDRIPFERESTTCRLLIAELGRTYRYMLGEKLSIRVNGDQVLAIDPVRLKPSPDGRAVRVLPRLELPFRSQSTGRQAAIVVQFATLPLEYWSGLTNAVKRDYRITKWSGISVLREQREIAYGWYFLGTKRRENYDDWWRCEVQFPAALDEEFGVTHSKQGVRPSRELLDALVPIVSSQAYRLNREIRQRFETLRNAAHRAERRAEDRHNRLRERENVHTPKRSLTRSLSGHRYRIQSETSAAHEFMRTVAGAHTTTVYLNSLHPFYTALYKPASDATRSEISIGVNAFVLALARALSGPPYRTMEEFIRRLSDFAAVFMERR